MPSLGVLDKDNLPQTIQTLPPVGPATAAASLPVTTATNDPSLTALSDVNDKLVTVNANLVTIQGYTDGLEALLAAIDTKLGTVSTSVDGLEGLQTTANSTLATIASDTSPAVVNGGTAADAPLTAAPVTVGGLAKTANPTAVSDGDVVNARMDKTGRTVVVLGQARELVTRSAVVTVSTTTETSLIGAGGAGVFLDMASIKLINSSATAVRVDVRDVTAGTVQDTWMLPPTDTRGAIYQVPLKQTTANSAWTIQLSGAVTDVRVVAQFVQNI